MTLKKMLLLAGMALAAVAFTAPAMAQASDEWYTDVIVEEEEEVSETLGTTTATGDTVELTGTLSSTKFPLRQTCEAHATARLWNHKVGDTHTATGHVTSLILTAPCTVEVFNVPDNGYTHLGACEITEATSNTTTPWHVNVATGTNGMDIVGANFTNTYKGCAGLGIPDGVKLGASGTATGTWNNTGGCIEFNNSGDLETEAKDPVTIDGKVCNSKLTLK